MFQHILAPDVDNECDAWFKCSNISEVLLRANAEIRVTSLYRLLDFRNNVLKRKLIRENVVPGKRTSRLRKIQRHLPKLSITELGGSGNRYREKPDRR